MKKNKPVFQKSTASASVLMATLMLPGIAAVSTLAHAENAPEHGTLAFKYGTYKDWQPGWDRISVRAPHLYALVPLGKEWSLEGGLVLDTLSGATPRMHSSSDISSATGYPGSPSAGMSDRRKAGDVKVTRYFSRSAVSVGAAYSKENDYLSKAISLDARFASEDNNRTWSFGLGAADDTIDSQFSQGVSAVAKGEHKRTLEFMVGVTQVMTPKDIVQLNITHSRGRGFFTDPYKFFDKRPDARDSTVGLVRWNHFVEPFDASVRTSYRYYSDTFGVASHTVGAEWVQSAGKWTITPGVRYYAQRAAKFYFDGIPDPTTGKYSPGLSNAYATNFQGLFAADQRLSAYGALTFSVKVDYAITDKTNVDVKLERYQQKSSYRLGGKGSPYIDPFNAQFVQVGLSTKF
jgi:Protein of unknown function (DUF3570)